MEKKRHMFFVGAAFMPLLLICMEEHDQVVVELGVPKSYMAYEKDAVLIYQLMRSVPHLKQFVDTKMEGVPMKEFSKVAEHFAKQEPASYKKFIDKVRADEFDATQKQVAASLVMTSMISYRYFKSQDHKQHEHELVGETAILGVQKNNANKRSVAIAIVGGIVTLGSIVLQHYFPSGC